jgi:hypothetical protein
LDPIGFTTVLTVARLICLDAPFVSRLYGESSVTNMVAGAKWRITGHEIRLGLALFPCTAGTGIRRTMRRALTSLQRGASPGGNIGDFGLTMFADARLEPISQCSVNLGYWLNSNPKGSGRHCAAGSAR